MMEYSDIKIKKTLLALLSCLIAIPLSRFISPQTFIDENQIYLAWLPLSVMYSVLFIFGRYAIGPLIIAFAIDNARIVDLTLAQAMILLFCQLVPVLVSCAIVRFQIGKRWRSGLMVTHMGVWIFWGGFFAPLLLTASVYMAGRFFSFPLAISGYFNNKAIIYTIIDIQSLISAGLIFTTFFYYPIRMIANPRYVRTFWRIHCQRWLEHEHRIFTWCWLIALIAILFVLCTPYTSDFIAGYLAPLIFILYAIGIGRLEHTLIRISWSVSAFLLVEYHQNFLHGVRTEYSLSFVLSLLISFTICLFYMIDIYARSERMKIRWRDQAEEDPLVGLPNLRALERHLQRNPAVAISSLRIQNLDFLSRHYGMMMSVESKRQIAGKLQPLFAQGERMFQLPGSELLLVLNGPEPATRLRHIVSTLNHKKFSWHNQALDLEFGASWCRYSGLESELYPLLGQLSWLSERAGADRRVVALDKAQEQISARTSEQVNLLAQIKQAINEGGLLLYAQPIQNAAGEGYYEILCRMRCGNDIITPARFIPLVIQFNLGQRFDMQVLQTLCSTIHQHPGKHFSVNLLPHTLMQKDSAAQIILLFKRYNLAPETITIEVTEEQVFSDVEISMYNLQQLRNFGCSIAIDDFGTGYANYARLKHLQADIVKIDGCFVRDIATNPLDVIMVKSIIEMAKAKNMKVVAEYVETQEQRTRLLQLGVDYLQGYLIGKSQPLSELRG